MAAIATRGRDHVIACSCTVLLQFEPGCERAYACTLNWLDMKGMKIFDRLTETAPAADAGSVFRCAW